MRWRAVPDDGLDVATGLLLGVGRGDPHAGAALCRIGVARYACGTRWPWRTLLLYARQDDGQSEDPLQITAVLKEEAALASIETRLTWMRAVAVR
jgi:hypothetical protein